VIVLCLAAALASGTAIVRASGARGAFAAAAGVVLGLSLSGAAWSAGLFLFGATGASADLLLLALAVLLWWRFRRPAPQRTQHRPPVFLVVACVAAAAVVSALFVEHSIRYPDGGWDAVAIWNLRARGLFAAPHDLALVFTPELAAQHPDYPPLLPALVAHGWFAIGAPAPAVPIAISFLFGAAGVVAVAAAVSERRGPALGLAAALLLLGTPELLTQATNQYADLKIAMLVLVAVVLATQERFAAAGLAAGLGALAKNEGLELLAVLLLAVWTTSGPRRAARLLAGAALPLALLLYFKLRWAPPNDLIAHTSLRDLLGRAPARVGIVLLGVARQVVDFGAWGCTLPFVLLAWIARWRWRERGVLSARFSALALLPIFGAFLATPWDPVRHMASALDRLIFQLWPSILYATAIALPPAAASEAAAGSGSSAAAAGPGL
jgi:hypothetical protein